MITDYTAFGIFVPFYFSFLIMQRVASAAVEGNVWKAGIYHSQLSSYVFICVVRGMFDWKFIEMSDDEIFAFEIKN